MSIPLLYLIFALVLWETIQLFHRKYRARLKFCEAVKTSKMIGRPLMVVGDPDQDGKLSLMIAAEKNGQIYDLEYKGEGDLADSSSWELTIAYDAFEQAALDLGDSLASSLSPRLYYGAIAGDMDGDGLIEYVFNILVGGCGNNEVYFFSGAFGTK